MNQRKWIKGSILAVGIVAVATMLGGCGRQMDDAEGVERQVWVAKMPPGSTVKRIYMPDSQLVWIKVAVKAQSVCLVAVREPGGTAAVGYGGNVPCQMFDTLEGELATKP